MLAVALLVGECVWADITPVLQDYSGDKPTVDWTSADASRYEVSVTDGVLEVKEKSNNNNGTNITGTTVEGKVPQGSDFATSDDFTLLFDLKLTAGNGGNAQSSSFYIYDATNSDNAAMLALNMQTANNNNHWYINGKIIHNVQCNTSDWYTFKLTKSGAYLYLTVTPTAGGDPVFAQQNIAIKSAKGGLGKMKFNTARYHAYMAIDNVELRAKESSDVPANAKTYSIKAKAGETTLATLFEAGATASGSEVKVSNLSWALTDGSHWYTLSDANVTDFAKTFTKGASDNEELTVDYTLDESIAYFAEAEGLSGSWYNYGQTQNYASSGLAKCLNSGKEATSVQSVTTAFSVAAGKYDLCAQVFKRSNNGDVSTEDVYEVNGDADPISKGTIGGEYAKTNVSSLMKLENITLSEGSDLRISHVGTGVSTAIFDYIYLKKSAVAYKVQYMCGGTKVKEDASRTAPWETHVTLAAADKADVPGTNKYYEYVSDNASSQVIAADGSTVITVYFKQIDEANKWDFMGLSSDADVTTGSTVIRENGIDCNEATYPDAVVELYLQGNWKCYKTSDSNPGLRNVSSGERQCIIPNLIAGDKIVITGNADAINGISGAKYDGTKNTDNNTYTVTMTEDGNYYFKLAKVNKSSNPAVYPAIKSIVVYRELTKITATINPAYGYASFSSTYALDFTDVTGLTAWIATGSNGDKVTMEQVTGTVAAGTGLILKGASDDIPVVANGTDYSGTNKLFAITSDDNLRKADDANYTNYVLAWQSSKVVFAPVTGTNTAPVKAGQAALCLQTSGLARALNIAFDDDEVTGVKSIENGQRTIDNYYDLQGRRVAQPSKGLYIVNGKKVIIK